MEKKLPYIKILNYAVIIIYHKIVDFTLKRSNFSMKMVLFFLNSRTYTISVRTKTNGVPVAIVATISKVWGRENIFWKALEMYRPLQNGSDGVTKWWACAKWMVWGYYSAQLIQFTYNQLLSVVVVDVTAHAMYIIFCSMYNN